MKNPKFKHQSLYQLSQPGALLPLTKFLTLATFFFSVICLIKANFGYLPIILWLYIWHADGCQKELQNWPHKYQYKFMNPTIKKPPNVARQSYNVSLILHFFLGDHFKHYSLLYRFHNTILYSIV